ESILGQQDAGRARGAAAAGGLCVGTRLSGPQSRIAELRRRQGAPVPADPIYRQAVLDQRRVVCGERHQGTGALERLDAEEGVTRAGSADLRIEGIGKRFGEVVALDCVSLAVAQGELLTILGPSGS